MKALCKAERNTTLVDQALPSTIDEWRNAFR
jgi:hypothetical protein